jgi:hypothetical protein
MLAKAIKDADPTEDTSLPIAVTYFLALWALQGKHSGDGYGFPFDRPLFDFAQRLLDLYRRLPELLGLLLNENEPYENQSIFNLACEISNVAEDLELCGAVDELRWRSNVFDDLRKTMRIVQVDGGNGLNDEGTTEAMSTIRQGVEQFRKELDNDQNLKKDHLSIKMAEQIDKYGDKLFADPIKVDSPKGPITIYPQRTNNILEQFFRGERHAYRRKTGNNTMSRTLQAMLTDTPLVRNLDNPDYMKILLDGKENLEELFSQLDATHFSNADDLNAKADRILPGFRALMKLPSLPDQIVRSLKKPRRMSKSN